MVSVTGEHHKATVNAVVWMCVVYSVRPHVLAYAASAVGASGGNFATHTCKKTPDSRLCGYIIPASTNHFGFLKQAGLFSQPVIVFYNHWSG
jgi:hypothetical protein